MERLFLMDMAGSILDWAFEHAPAITAGFVFLIFAVWFAVWVSGYATRFKHVETDVALLKGNMVVVNKRLIKMKKNFKALETRMDGFEKRMDSFDKKLDSLDQKFTALLTQLSLRNNEIRQ